MQTLYAVECLENRTRAKGSGLNFLFLNVAIMVNTYGISVGIDKIGWKLYLVYIGWICVELVVIYFVSCGQRCDLRTKSNMGCSSSWRRQERLWKNLKRSLRRITHARLRRRKPRWPWMRSDMLFTLSRHSARNASQHCYRIRIIYGINSVSPLVKG